MRLISFNVNGVRAAIKKGLIEWLEKENPDVFCMQEIKLSETVLVETQFKTLGYHCCWMPAEKKGYSGVAVLSKIEPISVEYGIGLKEFDVEGRVLQVSFSHFTLICAYFPSGTTGDVRQEVKMRFLEAFYLYCSGLLESGKALVICGDVNICHKPIDIHNPVSNKNSSGFLPEERAWVSSFLEKGFIDTFRYFHPDPHRYSWWSYRAGSRAKNLGWRIDYFFVSSNLSPKLKAADILQDINMSDHCPVTLTLQEV